MKKYFQWFNLFGHQRGTETFHSFFSCFMTQFFRMQFPLFSLSQWKFPSVSSTGMMEKILTCADKSKQKPLVVLIRKCFGFVCAICNNWWLNHEQKLCNGYLPRECFIVHLLIDCYFWLRALKKNTFTLFPLRIPIKKWPKCRGINWHLLH